MTLFTHYHGRPNQDPSSLGHWPSLDLEEDTHKGLDPKRQVLVDIRRNNPWAYAVDNDLG